MYFQKIHIYHNDFFPQDLSKILEKHIYNVCNFILHGNVINVLKSAYTMDIACCLGTFRLVLLYNLSEHLNVYSHITNIQTYLTNEINLFSWIHHKSTPCTVLNIHLFPINVLTTKIFIYIYSTYNKKFSKILGRPLRGSQKQFQTVPCSHLWLTL